MKRIALIITLIAAALMSACGQKGEIAATGETLAPNVPMFTVAPETEPAVETEITPDTASEATDPVPPETEAEASVSETEPEEADEEVIEDTPEEPDTRAMECLKLFNSDKVHAKFVEAYAVGEGEITSTTVEYFINGYDRVYLTNDTGTIITGGVAAFVDYYNKTYYTYPEEGGYGLDFGYDRDEYELESTSEENGVLTEVYKVEAENLESTWEFYPDGRIKVSDITYDGLFRLYDVEILESDVSKMDVSIPDGFTEVSADDYGYNG